MHTIQNATTNITSHPVAHPPPVTMAPRPPHASLPVASRSVSQPQRFRMRQPQRFRSVLCATTRTSHKRPLPATTTTDALQPVQLLFRGVLPPVNRFLAQTADREGQWCVSAGETGVGGQACLDERFHPRHRTPEHRRHRCNHLQRCQSVRVIRLEVCTGLHQR